MIRTNGPPLSLYHFKHWHLAVLRSWDRHNAKPGMQVNSMNETNIEPRKQSQMVVRIGTKHRFKSRFCVAFSSSSSAAAFSWLLCGPMASASFACSVWMNRIMGEYFCVPLLHLTSNDTVTCRCAVTYGIMYCVAQEIVVSDGNRLCSKFYYYAGCCCYFSSSFSSIFFFLFEHWSAL